MSFDVINRIARYCAEEVARQHAETVAVAWMVEAWLKAIKDWKANTIPTPDLVRSWGMLVEPVKNGAGFRVQMVRVGPRVCPPPGHLIALMATLFKPKILESMKPEEVYREFQEIHPFLDGNGRTGKILLNYLNSSLLDPIMPPNFWGCSNP